MQASEQLREHQAAFRFYGELSDFLPVEALRKDRLYPFTGKPSVKDAIEAQGVPHTEVALILVDGKSVGFGHHLTTGERVAVYPPFKTLDVTTFSKLTDSPSLPYRFAVDVNLGKLARWLRLLGFDAVYRNRFHDRELVDISVAEHRILLTRDRRLLRHKELTHAYWVRSDFPEIQVLEVLQRYGIQNEVQPFRRCSACNGRIRSAPKMSVLDRLEPLTRKYYEEFFKCDQCSKIYWRGSHHERLLAKISHALGE